MKKFAFISRHTPTEKQFELALAKGIELEQVGDRDAFSVNPDDFVGYDGVVVVHPAMALKLASAFAVGVAV